MCIKLLNPEVICTGGIERSHRPADAEAGEGDLEFEEPGEGVPLAGTQAEDKAGGKIQRQHPRPARDASAAVEHLAGGDGRADHPFHVTERQPLAWDEVRQAQPGEIADWPALVDGRQNQIDVTGAGQAVAATVESSPLENRAPVRLLYNFHHLVVRWEHQIEKYLDCINILF